MSNHEAQDREILIIPNDEGKDEEFEVLYTFEHNDTGKKYMFVTPVQSEEDDEEEYQEVLAFRYNDDGGEFRLEMIDEDNEEEWDMVEEMFNTLFSDWDEEEEGETEDQG
ncbi:DUF1292 domain-containing protein [Staphylospora marina]|uniref:DUF1292 domain-containing protein n=1 Tax=Staphylospora marina TaxID=2490858 RepID=UPI000F5BEDF9|nr:DUF1292 domain-containing protein [Staphylospora marina]